MKNKYIYDEDTKLNTSTLIVFTIAEHKIHKLEYKTIKDKGLTIAQFGVLEALYNKGDLTVGEIMERILTTSGNITVVVKNLERDGLVRRYPNEYDRRINMVSITPQGEAIIEDIMPEHIENINNIFNILTKEEKIQLKNILKKFK